MPIDFYLHCGTVGGPAISVGLAVLLAPFGSGPASVRIRYRNQAAGCELQLGDSMRVRLDDELLAQLAGWLQPENVEIVYQ